MKKPAENPEKQVQYLSYLLRLWQDGGDDCQWRSSLQSPQTGERLGFTSLEELFEFLREQTRPPEQISADKS